MRSKSPTKLRMGPLPLTLPLPLPLPLSLPLSLRTKMRKRTNRGRRRRPRRVRRAWRAWRAWWARYRCWTSRCALEHAGSGASGARLPMRICSTGADARRCGRHHRPQRHARVQPRRRDRVHCVLCSPEDPPRRAVRPPERVRHLRRADAAVPLCRVPVQLWVQHRIV